MFILFSSKFYTKTTENELIYYRLRGEQLNATAPRATSRGTPIPLVPTSNEQQPKGESTEQEIQIEVLKGHLARRNKLLSEQRTAYLKEITILREQLYRKHHLQDDELPPMEAAIETEDWGQLFEYGGPDG